MEQVFISIKKIKIKLIYFKIYSYISNRIKRGIIFEKLKYNASNFYKKKDYNSLKILFYSILCYCFSGTVAKKLIGKNFIDENEIILTEISLNETNKILFHWAPKEKLNNILKEGLLPGKSHDYVYITDDSEFIKNHGYLYYKTLNYNKKEMTFVKIAINTSKLAEKHKIFKTIRSHEYMVEKVPPDCFINY